MAYEMPINGFIKPPDSYRDDNVSWAFHPPAGRAGLTDKKTINSNR